MEWREDELVLKIFDAGYVKKIRNNNLVWSIWSISFNSYQKWIGKMRKSSIMMSKSVKICNSDVLVISPWTRRLNPRDSTFTKTKQNVIIIMHFITRTIHWGEMYLLTHFEKYTYLSWTKCKESYKKAERTHQGTSHAFYKTVFKSSYT